VLVLEPAVLDARAACSNCAELDRACRNPVRQGQVVQRGEGVGVVGPQLLEAFGEVSDSSACFLKR